MQPWTTRPGQARPGYLSCGHDNTPWTCMIVISSSTQLVDVPINRSKQARLVHLSCGHKQHALNKHDHDVLFHSIVSTDSLQLCVGWGWLLGLFKVFPVDFSVAKSHQFGKELLKTTSWFVGSWHLLCQSFSYIFCFGILLLCVRSCHLSALDVFYFERVAFHVTDVDNRASPHPWEQMDSIWRLSNLVNNFDWSIVFSHQSSTLVVLISELIWPQLDQNSLSFLKLSWSTLSTDPSLSLSWWYFYVTMCYFLGLSLSPSLSGSVGLVSLSNPWVITNSGMWGPDGPNC